LVSIQQEGCHNKKMDQAAQVRLKTCDVSVHAYGQAALTAAGLLRGGAANTGFDHDSPTRPVGFSLAEQRYNVYEPVAYADLVTKKPCHDGMLCD
jgi:hypothetical protein